MFTRRSTTASNNVNNESILSSTSNSNTLQTNTPRSPLNDLLDPFDMMDVSSDSVDAVRRREIEIKNKSVSFQSSPSQVENPTHENDEHEREEEVDKADNGDDITIQLHQTVLLASALSGSHKLGNFNANSNIHTYVHTYIHTCMHAYIPSSE